MMNDGKHRIHGNSRHWNFLARVFQSLEKITSRFPGVGTFWLAFSNRWKISLPAFQALENHTIPFEMR